jgi:hypothetical protein
VLAGRRVRWWSWAALALVGIGMVFSFIGRGAFALPLAAI